MPPSEATSQYPLPPGVAAMADDRRVQRLAAPRAEEAGVAVVEDAPVGGHEPISAAVVGRRHADDRLVQRDAAGRAEKARVAVIEDAAVACDHPVALAVGGGGHRHGGALSCRPPAGPKKPALPKLTGWAGLSG